MILSLLVSVKEISDQGRDFPWPRPDYCPFCQNNRLWGHGFVMGYFDSLAEGIWLRRWRCPLCGAVHRMRPAGYFPRFHASVSTIRQSIACRLSTGRWPPGISRSRQGHWLLSLRRKILAYWGQGLMDRLLDGFDRLLKMGWIPVSRSI